MVTCGLTAEGCFSGACGAAVGVSRWARRRARAWVSRADVLSGAGGAGGRSGGGVGSVGACAAGGGVGLMDAAVPSKPPNRSAVNVSRCFI
jgi:hypothetical protein